MSKYGNRKVEAEGFKFDSQAEYKRFTALRLLVLGNYISDLEVHPRFPLVVNGVKVGTYIGDFRYTENGQSATEDVKGVKTAVYQLKKKLVKALYNVDIVEIEA